MSDRSTLIRTIPIQTFRYACRHTSSITKIRTDEFLRVHHNVDARNTSTSDAVTISIFDSTILDGWVWLGNWVTTVVALELEL